MVIDYLHYYSYNGFPFLKVYFQKITIFKIESAFYLITYRFFQFKHFNEFIGL